MPKWGNRMSALDWLYELFWSEVKIFPTTHLIDPSDLVPDIGPGKIDFFEYLRHTIKSIYKQLPPKYYEEKYFVFHKKDI